MSTKDTSNEEPAPDTIYPKKLSNISISIILHVFSFLSGSPDGNVLRSNILYKLGEHLADL